MDFSKIKIDSKDPVYVQISTYVKKQILNGNIASGDELPSRRELAMMLEINPNTVQKAYKLMESEGYVITFGNTGSTILIHEDLMFSMQNEFTKTLILDFVNSAKDINLSFKYVIDLISEAWEKV